MVGSTKEGFDFAQNLYLTNYGQKKPTCLGGPSRFEDLG
jgi:hypothetical protein